MEKIEQHLKIFSDENIEKILGIQTIVEADFVNKTLEISSDLLLLSELKLKYLNQKVTEEKLNIQIIQIIEKYI